MILTKEVKIKAVQNLTSEYIETGLRNMGYDVLRWAIVSADKEIYNVSVSFVEKKL